MHLSLLLAQAQSTSGPGTGGTAPPPGGGLGGMEMLLFLVLIVGVMWFIVFRPQRKQEKKRREMLAQMAKNDHVLTIGGIHAIVYAVDEDAVVLKIDERNDVRIRVAKSAVAQVLDKADQKEEKLSS